MQEAINIRADVRKHRLYLKTSYYVQPSFKRALETLDCAHFIIDQFNREYNPATENSPETQKHFARKIKELIRDVLKNSNVTDDSENCAIKRWAEGDNELWIAAFLHVTLPKYPANYPDSREIKIEIFKLFKKVYIDLIFTEVLDNWNEGKNDEQTYRALLEAMNKHKPMIIHRI